YLRNEISMKDCMTEGRALRRETRFSTALEGRAPADGRRFIARRPGTRDSAKTCTPQLPGKSTPRRRAYETRRLRLAHGVFHTPYDGSFAAVMWLVANLDPSGHEQCNMNSSSDAESVGVETGEWTTAIRTR